MQDRLAPTRLLPAALLALGVVMLLGSLGDPALALAVCSREVALSRNENGAADPFLASLARGSTKPAPAQNALPAIHPPQLSEPPRQILRLTPNVPRTSVAVYFPHLFSLPPPQA